MSIDTAKSDPHVDATAAAQASSDEPILTDHSYDGIQEYDNPLPGWWKFLFWVSIFFAPMYWVYFHMDVEGRSIHDGYKQHMASVFEQRFEEIGILEPDQETILKYMNEPEWLKVGEVIYEGNCVSCHKADGSGLVGPNLTDEHWKNVRKIEDLATVISEGAASGSMPAWKTRLTHPNQIVLTAAYVATMRRNPVPGKAAEGDKIPAWE